MSIKKLNVTKDQLAVLSLIEANNLITISDMSDILKTNNSAVQRHIECLKDAEILKREGGRHGGKWTIAYKVI